ncbi:MAG TPA: hypothetical protein ENK06_00240 [Gammaproteobacteria bacterium]|nr:hypothetical protein [Gammaproteobacteria bacterium]
MKNGVIFYPENKRVAIDDLDDDLFKNMAKQHDAIVMLVRPNGFDSFNKSYFKVTKTKKKISYEPVDAETQIAFLRKATGS